MDLLIDIVITVCLVASGIFGFVGSFGLIKLSDAMSRLHAPTKATTLGVGGVLIASILHAWLVEGAFTAHELLITLFLLLTAPVTAMFIAKSHIHRHESPSTLPESGEDSCWAVFDTGQGSGQAAPAAKPDGAA